MPHFSSSDVVVITLWVLAAFSVATWTLIVAKAWAQWRLSKENREFRQAFWHAKGLREAEQVSVNAAGPLARLAQAGFRAMRDMHKSGEQSLEHSGDQQDILERCLRSQAQKELHQLESGLMVLASIGSTAPFVGLFGTVWGIMHALQDISKSGSAGLDVVAGPIGEALIATALGIATAIPAVLAYNYGLRRVRLYSAEMENFATDFLHLAMKSSFKVE
ncbi:MAG: MotA/TolQ/ExbB proton channel family protein [Sulfuricella sp.]|nr:MotA/TolQ/ExbB proton channel family protein [Sulfuricella sp.]